MPTTDGQSSSVTLVRRDDIDEVLPNRVFVLCCSEATAPGLPELCRTERNELMITAYSSLTLLVAIYGEGAPWVEVSRESLDDACGRLAVTLIALDTALPDVPGCSASDVRDQPDLAEMAQDPVDGQYLYIPSRPIRNGQTRAHLELQHYQGNRTLLVYTSPEELATGCGPHQAWVAIHANRLAAVMGQCGAGGVLFNPELSEAARHTGPVHDWTRPKSSRR